MPVAIPFLAVDHGRKVVTVCPNTRIAANLCGCYSHHTVAGFLRKDKPVELPFRPPKGEGIPSLSPKTFQQAHFQFCKLPRPQPGFSLVKVNQFYQRLVDEGYRIDVHPRCECKKAFLLTYLSDMGLGKDVENLHDMDEETLQYLLCSALRGEYGGIAFIANFQLEKVELEKTVEETENQQRGLEERLASANAAIATLRLEIEKLVRSLEELRNKNLSLAQGGWGGDPEAAVELTRLRRERDESNIRLQETNVMISTLQSDKEALVRSMEEAKNQHEDLGNHLRSEKDELENRLVSSDAVAATLRSEKDLLERSLEESSNQKHELENRLAVSDAVADALRSQKELLERMMEESSNQKQELETRLINSNVDFTQLMSERESLQRSMEESANQQRELEDQLANSGALVATLQSENKTMVLWMKGSKRQKHELENRLANSDVLVAKLQSHNKTLVKQMKGSKQQQQELENRLAYSDAFVANLQSENKKILRQMKGSTDQQHDLEKSLARSQKVVIKLQSEKETLLKSIDESTSQLRGLENRLASSYAEFQAEKKSLVKSMKELIDQQEKLKTRFADFREFSARLQSEKERLASLIEGSANQQEELEQRLATSDAAISDLQRENEGLARSIEERKSQQQELRDSLASAMTNRSSAKESLRKAKEKLLNAERARDAAITKSEGLQSQLNTSNRANEKLRVHVDELESAIKSNKEQQLVEKGRRVNADNVGQKDILDKLDLDLLNGMDAASLRNLVSVILRGDWNTSSNRRGGNDNFIEEQAFGIDWNKLVGLSLHEKEARLVTPPTTVTPRKKAASTHPRDPPPRSSMGRVSQWSISEEESVSSGMDSEFPTEEKASKLPSRREEEGGKSQEPPLVDEAAVAATSKLSKSLVCESKTYESLTSMRKNNKKRKWSYPHGISLDDAQGQHATKHRDGLEPPVLAAPSFMQLPTTGHCKWSYDEKSRVLLANFRPLTRKFLHPEDENFLFQMMERDDVTVISEGLADEINPSLWTREYIEGCIGLEYHHKIRVFETVSNKNGRKVQSIKEKAGWYSMRISDYFEYLEQRKRKNSGIFSFTDSEGMQKTVNVNKEALYMLDLDMVKLLPQLFEDFRHNFKLPGILPGGSHCMMNAVNGNGQPFMGPNIYITPSSSFTQWHQDGYGTVDSSHLCLGGYNEVIMLRRLTEKEKRRALRLLTGSSDSDSNLYDFPHHDDVETRLTWPSKEAIRQCEELGFCPSVFVLKSGQVLHINKGRLHAFRKLSPSKLSKTDCHFDLRNQILQTKGKLTEDICFSIAWDWMYKGVTCGGIHKEISSILECARLNRDHEVPSLAIPETSLIFIARQSIAKHQSETMRNTTKSLFEIEIPQQSKQGGRPEPDAETVLRGILPSLTYVVRSHKSAAKRSERIRHGNKSSKVSFDSHPDARENPDKALVDPYGNEDFCCKICGEELSNVYMHCDGCEKLLNKDYNICCTCHKEGKHNVFHQVNPFTNKQDSTFNHTGNMEGERKNNCCGQACTICSYCTGCSCKCHQCFTLHFRFMGLKEEVKLLEQAKSIVDVARKK